MMNVQSLARNERNYKLLGIFIVCWVVVNIIQAAFTGLYPDEAYYWMYSRHLQWGYFDHPPIVALLIKLGDLIYHNSLFTRLGTVLFSTASVFFLFKALPEEIAKTKIYIISFLSVILFHIYGFVATPDAALFFFTALFFYAYRLYLKKQSLTETLFLSLSIAGLLYSKYHGILPVFFTFLSNPRLVFKPTAWLAVLLVIVFLFPHIYWQYIHEWPTLRYHLSERVGSRYRISKTSNYLLGQLMVWGPLTAAPVFYFFLKLRKQELFIKAHQFTFWGVLVFFFISSFNSSIEPHWTLVAGVSFIVLLQQVLLWTNPKFIKLFTQLAFVNIFLMVILRILLALPHSPIARASNFKPLFYGRAWADSVHKYTGSTSVVFIDSYMLPSLYQYYYPNVSTTSFNTIIYRKNQFSISDDEIKMNNKKVYAETGMKIDSTDLFVTSPYTNTYLHLIDSFKAVNALRIQWKNRVKKAKSGAEINAFLTITNLRNETIIAEPFIGIGYTFYKTRRERQTSENIIIKNKEFAPAEEKAIDIKMRLPKNKGKYRLIFSINYYPFQGTLASNFFDIAIE